MEGATWSKNLIDLIYEIKKDVDKWNIWEQEILVDDYIIYYWFTLELIYDKPFFIAFLTAERKHSFFALLLSVKK